MLSIFNKINHFFDAAPSALPSLPSFRLKPAESGESINEFHLKTDQGFWDGKPSFIGANNSIIEKQLFKKPIVIAFYSPEWKNYGLEQVQMLQNLQQDINVLGGQLLVIADTDLRTLKSLITEHSFQLNFYSDPDHILSENLGVYDRINPIYNRISGIDKNAPLLATYVISPERKVSYRYIDNLGGEFPAKELLKAVVASNTIN